MGCGCLLALFGSAFPRLALLFTWLFTDRVAVAFHHGWLAPLAGLVFLPFTTLLYVLVYAPVRGVTGFGWFLVILGFLCDLSSYGAGARGRQQQTARR
ncbi:hypothetical protein GCM10009839_69990 [Catenulispora yoronensis]|uniref:Uncharacterized protein n=1 Tax=Catenulispora yoronensis TaxID=450799 RepID=A0ABP5GW32_9ACTN